jgi:uncharacterized membrane-anchored protein YitT (DUF2179 family)
MNSFWIKVITKTVLRDRKKNGFAKRKYTKFELMRGYRTFQIMLRREVKNLFLITIGVFLAAFGFKGFLLTNHFIDGGATGVSLLISALTKFPLHYLIICVNLPFVVMGYHVVGSRFAVRTSLAIAGLSLVLATVTFPNVTNDNLLVAIFGGFFLGAGIGFSIRGGAVIDGTEVLAIYLSRKIGATIGDVIITINVVIFSVAAYFLGVEVALYSMITYLAASKTLDFIVEGIEEYIGVTIVSGNSDEIREMIINKMGRGVTIYNGKKGFGKRGETIDTEIIYTVITRLEQNKLTTELEKIDPIAFLVMNSVKDTKGGMIKKRPLDH